MKRGATFFSNTALGQVVREAETFPDPGNRVQPHDLYTLFVSFRSSTKEPAPLLSFKVNDLQIEERVIRLNVIFPMFEVQFETVFFSGRVQGVGFRYQTLQVAKEFEVAGFVQNLPDGRVQLEVEGAADEVNAFVTAVEERMHGYIRKTERHSARRAPQFQGFAIR